MRRSAKPIKKPHLQGSIVFGSNTPNWLYRRCDNVRANRGQSLARMKRRVRVRQSAIAYEDALSVTQDRINTSAQRHSHCVSLRSWFFQQTFPIAPLVALLHHPSHRTSSHFSFDFLVIRYRHDSLPKSPPSISLE
jgi:hypothetical protein